MREKRVEKFQIMVGDTELKNIDDWRFATRAASRSSAIRKLIFLGLKYWERNPEEAVEDLKRTEVD